jgi:hypothetical protein
MLTTKRFIWGTGSSLDGSISNADISIISDAKRLDELGKSPAEWNTIGFNDSKGERHVVRVEPRAGRYGLINALIFAAKLGGRT